MKNLRSGWRYSSEDKRDTGKVWRVRNSNHKEETSGQHRHNASREGGREERGSGWGGTGWGDSERTEYEPSSTAPSNRRVDGKGTETKTDDGWGCAAIDNTMSEDLTSAWEALATTNLSDWSKPPQIDSIVHWDDAAARDTYYSVKYGHSYVNKDPDLYLERNIDWNTRIPPDLLVFVDNKSRYRKTSPPRSGSPVLLGLENLAEPGWGNEQSPQGKAHVEVPKFIQSRDKLEHVGGSGSWGADANQNGQRRSKQQQYNNEQGGPGQEKQNNLIMRDDYKDRGRKRRGGINQLILRRIWCEAFLEHVIIRSSIQTFERRSDVRFSPVIIYDIDVNLQVCAWNSIWDDTKLSEPCGKASLGGQEHSS